MKHVDLADPLAIFDSAQIRSAINLEEAVESVRHALVAHSNGKSVSMPIGLMQLADHSEVHVKSGHVRGAGIFVVKVATMFPANRGLGIATSDGFMVACSAHTGQPLAVLHDRKWLTDLRTAAVGAIAADVLASEKVDQVAVMGTGGQAYLQVRAVALVRRFQRVVVWGRDRGRADLLRRRLEKDDMSVTVTSSAEQAVRESQIVITTTASRTPILHGRWLVPGHHITAVGADDAEKLELDSGAYARADKVFVDGRELNLRYGDLASAIRTGDVPPSRIDGELGELLDGRVAGRGSAQDITISKHVGLGIEDAAIAEATLRALGMTHLS